MVDKEQWTLTAVGVAMCLPELEWPCWSLQQGHILGNSHSKNF